MQRRLEDLQQELEELQLIISFLDEALAERSFRRLEATLPSTSGPASPTEPVTLEAISEPQIQTATVEYKQVIPLKSSDGLLLGTIYISVDDARIIPSSDLKLSSSIPPFQPFFLNRVLEPMVRRDQEAVASDAIHTSRQFSYEVVEDGDVLKEIIIHNYGDERRLREVRSSVRWTLEKMYEKVRNP